MPSTPLIRCLPLLTLLCLSAIAHADADAALPPDILEASKRHYESGAAFYKDGKFVQAQVEFMAAYRLSKLADLLYNLARVSEKMGQPAEAADYYDRYLKERPDAPDRGTIEEDMARLRKVAEPPAPPPAVVTPPPPVVAPPPPPRRVLPPWPALGLLGGGAVLLIVGAGLGGAAHAAAGEVENGERFDAALDARGRSLQSGGIFFDVVGALALSAGAAWAAVWWVRRGKEAAPAKAALRLAPTGAGLSLSGSF